MVRLTRRAINQALAAQAPVGHQMRELMPAVAKPRKPRSNEEAILQVACVKLLRSLPATLVFSVPNHLYLGSSSNRIYYVAKQKSLGLLPGAPDLVLSFLSSNQQAVTLFLELKSSSGGLSDNQKDVQAACLKIGVPYCVIRSVDELISLLKLHGYPSLFL